MNRDSKTFHSELLVAIVFPIFWTLTATPFGPYNGWAVAES